MFGDRMFLNKKNGLESISEDGLYLLSQCRFGFERECLRVTTEGNIALSPHPKALGSALTHPFFTKDYSEALLEIITPPYHKVGELHAHLEKLHTFVYRQIGPELLWAGSMPCKMGCEDEIPLAYFGISNRGQMKRIYRHGLKLRYGSRMQVIAGNHFNFSLSTEFWKFFYKKNNASVPFQDFVSDQYMRIARNFLRINPLIIYLFGANPTVDKSFLEHRNHQLKRFDKDTYYLPYGTSLRLSDLGYKNPVQAELKIDYNSIEGYTRSLNTAIHTLSPKYQKFGVFKDGVYQQLSANLLQIDNEHYGMVRPKRKAPFSVMSTHVLNKKGVDYLEIRSLDVDPFSPTGVEPDQLHFLKLTLIACLLTPSPLFDSNQLEAILANHDRVVLSGRQKGLKLVQMNGNEVKFKTWAIDYLTQWYPLALLLDQKEGHSLFVQALEQQIHKVKNPDLTPSGKALQMMRSSQLSFIDFHLALAHQHKQVLGKKTLENTFMTQMKKLATASIEEQQQIEASDEKRFEVFLEEYFNPQ